MFFFLFSLFPLKLVTLHPGECYAIENMTKTDRLGLLLSGKANVLTEKTFLHHVCPGEFLDSPEFESSTAAEDTFKVMTKKTSLRLLGDAPSDPLILVGSSSPR